MSEHTGSFPKSFHLWWISSASKPKCHAFPVHLSLKYRKIKSFHQKVSPQTEKVSHRKISPSLNVKFRKDTIDKE